MFFLFKISQLVVPLEGKRVVTIDIMRGVAALMVVLFHYTGTKTIQFEQPNLLYQAGKYGFLGVEVFFIISGFVITLSLSNSGYQLKNFFTFIKKRIIRIDVPYISSIIVEIILIYLVFLTGLRNELSERLVWSDVLLHVFYLNGLLDRTWLIPVYWTLAIEFQFYIILALVYSRFVNSLLWRVILFLLFFSVGMWLDVNYIFSHVHLFFLGITCYFIRKEPTDIKNWIFLIGIILLIYIRYDLPLFVVCNVTVLITLFGNFKNSLLKFLGKISYSIYLIHVPFGGRILKYVNSSDFSDFEKSIVIIITFLLTIPVAWVFYLIFEKTSQRLASKIRYN